MDSTSAIIYPNFTENALIMSIQALERTSLSHGNGDRPTVRAAGAIGRYSSTEIIDVNRLSQKSTSVIQYVEVADSEGRLYCMDGLVSTPCWLKIVSFAKDCQSSNVLLMTTDKGVVLKTIRNITPGEPLLMWFTENILAMMNMPFLTPCNIQGQNRYVCHMCNNLFEYPNPLKIHLALKCNRLDSNYLWSVLAKEFSLPRSSLSLSLFPQSTFKFELTKSPLQHSPARLSPRHSPARISPIIVESMDSSISLVNNSSSSSSNEPFPSSSTQDSPNSSSTQVSPDSITPVFRHSAFKPYMGQSNLFAGVVAVPTTEENTLTPYNSQATVATPTTADIDAHAAQMETIVSNLGKSKQGHLCIYCGKVYSRKYGLKIHIRTHTGYKPLKCKYCFRPFGDPSNLNKHVRLHADGETPYRCELCGKVLVRRRDLERHIRSRHQENVEQASDTSSDEIEV